MAILPIRPINDPVLHQRAKRVSSIDDSIQRLIDDMIDTMQATSGAGLAAPQVGVPLRVAVIQLPEEEVITLINPEIVKRSDERQVTEGCLCLPGYQGEITRAASVTVKARNRQGKLFRIRGEGLLAQALEHEIDHLNGITYVDHLESMDKLEKLEPKPEDTE